MNRDEVAPAPESIAADPLSWSLSRTFLRMSVFSIMAGSLAGIAVIFTFIPEQALRALGPTALLLIAVVVGIQLSRNKVRSATLTLVAGTWLVVTVLCYFYGGIRTPIIAIHPFIVLLAGWLLGRRAAIALSSLSILTGLAFVFADSGGLLPAQPPTPLMIYWVVQTSVIALSCALVLFLVRSYQKSIEEARSLHLNVTRLSREAELNKALQLGTELMGQTGRLAKVGGWELDVPRHELNWTSEVFRIHGLDPGPVPTVKQAIEFYSPEARPVIEAAIQAAVDSGIAFDQVLPLVTADGRSIWVRTVGEAQSDETKVVRLIGAIQDISEQMQAAQHLKRSIANLQRTLDATGDGIFAYDGRDPSGRLLFANEHFFRIWNIPLDEAPRTGRAEIIAAARKLFIDPDAEVQRINDILAKPELHEDVVHLNDGRVLSRRSIPIAGDDGVSRVWSFRDITRQEQALVALQTSETQLNLAQQIARVGSFDWYPVANHLLWSDEHFRLWGFAPHSVLPNYLLFQQGIHPDDLPRVEATLQHALNGGRYYDCEHRVLWRDGTQRHIHGRGEVIFDGLGKPVRVIGTVQDITERLDIEAALIAARDEAEKASRAKSAFLANMSHELRTPMNAIIGMNSLALRKADDPVLRSHLEKVAAASKHLLAVINDILDISKIEAGRLVLDRTEFRFDEVLETLGILITPEITRKHLSLNIQTPSQLTGRVFLGDRQRIGQVLLNLVANAIKFTDNGGITIDLGVIEEAPTGTRLRLAVTDTGVGIAETDRARLFMAFEQADGSTTRKYGGTGLGLSICRRLVTMMDGEIGVDSTLGQGSTFWFSLLLERADGLPSPAENEQALSLEELKKAIRTQFSGLHVLLAEDDCVNQEVSEFMLEEVGLVADLAEDGQKALEMAQQTVYPLILMDVQMPRMSGIEATELIRQFPAYRRTPILAMTANAFDEDRQTCLKAGMNDHIGKPVDAEILYRTLLKWLTQRQPRSPDTAD